MGVRLWKWAIGSRVHGAVAFVPLLIRLVAGTFVVGAGFGKFLDHAQEVRDFRGFGVPLPDLAVPLAGTIEVVGGILVVIGLLTRPAALLVAANLLGALLTAGINEGGTFHLVIGPSIMLAMLVLVWTGAGAYSIDGRLLGPSAHTPS